VSWDLQPVGDRADDGESAMLQMVATPRQPGYPCNLMTVVVRTSSTSTRAAEKQASRARDSAAITSGRKTVQDLRRENEAFTYARSAVSIGFARSFSR
jgi:hypothetical protein